MKNSQFVDRCEKNGADGMTSVDNLTLSFIARTNSRLEKPSFIETIREARMQIFYQGRDDISIAMNNLTQTQIILARMEISESSEIALDGMLDKIEYAVWCFQRALNRQDLEIKAMEIANEETAS